MIIIMTKEQYIEKNIPIEDLKADGFFKPNDNYEDMEKRLCKFFGLKNIFMYSYIGLNQEKPVKAYLNTFSDN